MVDRILAIGAHADDVEVGTAGLLQRAEKVFILIASHGERGGDPIEREREACAAISLLGAEGRICNHPDTAIVAAQLASDIEQVIKSFRPTLILTHSPNDIHQDHAAVSHATTIAARDFVGTVLAYYTPSVAERFRPNWFASLDEATMNTKKAAIACHASQSSRPYLAPAYIEAAGRYWSQVTRSERPFVEPYELLRHREP